MKILYGVPSEGMGHATRSKVIIEHLLENGHDIRIATSDRAFELLEKSFPGRGIRIEGLHLNYKQGGIDKSASVANFMATARESLAANIRQYFHLRKESPPAAVISDFESFTYLFAKLGRTPLLSIDNMQVINRCKLGIDIPADEKESYRLARAAVKAKLPYCNRYLVSAFFDAPPIKKNTRIIPPILRDIVLKTAGMKLPSSAHILVYQTATSQSDLISGLQKVRNESFIVYGLGRDETLGNVILRSFSEEGFVRELATARGVITNGGFSLISEAVYLRRPVCSFPLGGQFEQYINGTKIEQLGFGRSFSSFSPDAVKAYLYDLKRFSSTLAGYRQNGNRRTFEEVDRFIRDVDNGTLEDDEKSVK
jgi:uncharacterized protein (TIGR00661 family)